MPFLPIHNSPCTRARQQPSNIAPVASPSNSGVRSDADATLLPIVRGTKLRKNEEASIEAKEDLQAKIEAGFEVSFLGQRQCTLDPLVSQSSKNRDILLWKVNEETIFIDILVVYTTDAHIQKVKKKNGKIEKRGKATDLTGKKRSRSDDGFNDLVAEIHDYIGAYKHVATYFQNESENNTRKMKIFEEIMQLPGFSTEEIMNAGEHILKDAHKLDTFFALPKELRSHYMVKQII
nr:SWI/SNF complex subunit SWI3D isoform X1 [Ipomoea batatas]